MQTVKNSLDASIKHLTELMQKFKEEYPDSEMTDPFVCKVHTDNYTYLHLAFEHITIAWVEEKQSYLVSSNGKMVSLLFMDATIEFLRGFEFVFNVEVNPIDETFDDQESYESATHKLTAFKKELCNIHD
jgi:hypothetical protein